MRQLFAYKTSQATQVWEYKFTVDPLDHHLFVYKFGPPENIDDGYIMWSSVYLTMEQFFKNALIDDSYVQPIGYKYKIHALNDDSRRVL